ncbi:hypothetical protein NXC14_PA00022 (plasmid) [Rhizobium sp. NXC14]|nr:hypothetical protein NXC14_PA00022 [Rhizobium sp. NXC14]
MKIRHQSLMRALPRWWFAEVTAPLRRANKPQWSSPATAVIPCRHQHDQIVKW